MARLKALSSSAPLHWVMGWDDVIGAAIERKIQVHKPDIVIVEHLAMTRFLPYIKRATNAKLVLVDHNVESLWHAQSARQFGFTLKGIIHRSQSGSVRKTERAMLGAFDMTIAISDTDRETLQQMVPSARVRFVPIGVDMGRFIPQHDAEENDLIVFVGGLNVGTNVDGLKFLVHEILPLVRQKHSGARVEIVGRAPTSSILALNNPPITKIIADVPDVRPYMARAAVCVVPIRPKSGVRLKILEGFAMAKAMVSTSLAAEGLDVVDGEHLFIRDDAQSFADAIVKLLADKTERQRLGASALALARKKYSWEAACARFEENLAELTGNATCPQES